MRISFSSTFQGKDFREDLPAPGTVDRSNGGNRVQNFLELFDRHVIASLFIRKIDRRKSNESVRREFRCYVAINVSTSLKYSRAEILRAVVRY